MRDGNGFYAKCANPEDINKALCPAYVAGLHDMAGYLWASGRVRAEVCPSAAVTVPQYVDILLKYLRDNPEQRHKPTGELMWTAASKAFPCSPR